ncbi:MAG: hypothetical protein M3170_05300 [Candidatus Dormibacteraeota bacterium]|nr:hypothetical protein [Candidatus Dormibacteraeota bacterium]
MRTALRSAGPARTAVAVHPALARPDIRRRPAVRDRGQGRAHGQIWYDPASAKTFGLTDATVPGTWEQMVSLSNRIKGSGRTPWCMGDSA